MLATEKAVHQFSWTLSWQYLLEFDTMTSSRLLPTSCPPAVMACGNVILYSAGAAWCKCRKLDAFDVGS